MGRHDEGYLSSGVDHVDSNRTTKGFVGSEDEIYITMDDEIAFREDGELPEGVTDNLVQGYVGSEAEFYAKLERMQIATNMSLADYLKSLKNI